MKPGTTTTLQHLIDDVGVEKVLESLIGICDRETQKAKFGAAKCWHKLYDELHEPLYVASVLTVKLRRKKL